MIALLDAFDRFVGLLVVPVGAALLPWLVFAALGGAGTGANDSALHMVFAFCPLIGAVAALAYGVLKVTARAVVPLVPFAVLTVCSCAMHLIALARQPTFADEVSVFPEPAAGAAFLLSLALLFAAIAGGVLCLHALRPRAPW